MNTSLKKSLSYVIRGGVATSAMDTLALGPTLIAYAKLLGAGNITFGILNSIPYFGNLMNFFVVWLFKKGHSARKISLISSFASRPFYFLIALLAFCSHSNAALPLLILFLTASYLIGCISGGCWMPWMKALVPENIIGRFFSARFKYMQIAKILCFLFAAGFLKYIKEYHPQAEIYAYSALFFFAFIIGIYGAYTFIHVENKPIPFNADIPLFRQFSLSLRNKQFCRLLLCLSLLNFGFAFITPFITVFMLNRLNISISNILIFTLTSQIFYVFVIKKLGRISDRFGCDKILMYELITMLFILAILIAVNYFAAAQQTLIIATMWILHIILGLATAAYTLGINNSSLLYISHESSAVYLTVNSVLKSFAGAIGSLIAGPFLSLCLLFGNHTHFLSDTPSADGWLIFFITGILLTIGGIFCVKYYLDTDPRHRSSTKENPS